jgi:hypothetical protein
MVLLARTGLDVNVPKVEASQTTLEGALGVVYMWAAIVAVLVIVISGFLMVTSRGDATKVARARNGILAASVGLVVVLMAFVITQFVLGSVAG